MRIKQKLLCGFVAVFLLTFIVSFASDWVFREEAISSLQKVGGKTLPGNVALARMTSELYHTLVLLSDFDVHGNVEDKHKIEKALSTLSTYKTMHALYHGEEATEETIDEFIQRFTSFVAEYMLLAQKGVKDEKLYKVKIKIDELLDNFVSTITPHIEKDFIESSRKLEAVKEKNRNARRLLLSSSALILVVAFWLSLFISNLLSRPLLQLRDAAREIGRGKLDVELPTESGDEISELAHAFNQMAGNLSSMRKELVSARDYIDNVVRSMADALIVVSPEGEFEAANSAAYALLGYQENEIVGEPIVTIIEADLFKGSDLAELAEKEIIKDLNVSYRTKNGERIPVSISGSTMRDSEGELQAVIIVARDIRELTRLVVELNTANQQLKEEIAERIMTEKALKKSERNYREIFDATNEAIFLHDAEQGDILDVNQSMIDMYGYEYEEVLSLSIGDLSANASSYSQEEGLSLIRQAVEKGPQMFDWRARRKNGELFWTEIALKSTEIGGQGRVLAVVRDVTKRKQAEKALEAERERLAVTLRSIGDGVITTDVKGKVVLVNKVAEKMTGWRQDEAVGRPFSEVFHIINEETREICKDPVEKVIATGKIIGLANNTVLVARNGIERCIADSGAPIRDKKSRVIGAVLVFSDVTEKKKMEEEFLKVKKLESLGVLAGGIAHDFNNILTAILGNINLATMYLTSDDQSYSLLEAAEKASLRAKNLTQQLLTFSKGGDPVKELASIAEVIRESSDFILRGSNVRCEYHFVENLWPVEIDSGQISQVVQNIIINANHAMPEGGVIDVTCENQDNTKNQSLFPMFPQLSGRYIKIIIKDCGIGIPQDHMEKVFDPYFSTKHKGSGLGLAITHSIIKNHEGHILVDSKRGMGTTFTILLPAAERKNVFEPQGDIELKSGGTHRIMIMDDEEQVRDIAENMLSFLGYEAVLVTDGGEALDVYKNSLGTEDAIDVIIMDLTIPGGMGGREAVKKILATDRNAKIIASSGYSNDPVMANFKEYGFLGAITKPFLLKEVGITLQKILQS